MRRRWVDKGGRGEAGFAALRLLCVMGGVMVGKLSRLFHWWNLPVLCTTPADCLNSRGLGSLNSRGSIRRALESSILSTTPIPLEEGNSKFHNRVGIINKTIPSELRRSHWLYKNCVLRVETSPGSSILWRHFLLLTVCYSSCPRTAWTPGPSGHTRIAFYHPRLGGG